MTPPVRCAVRSLETRIPAPVVTAALGAAMKGYTLWHGVVVDPSPLRMQLGVGLSLLSAAIGVAGFAGLILGHTTINPLQPAQARALVTTGVFRFSRNPLYLSLLLLLVAYAVRIDSVAVWLAPLAFIGYVTRFQIVPEERALEHKFGDAFGRYRARTRRWI